MKLTEKNYYSVKANQAYCSKSQFNSFYGVDGCEARALAEINGEYERPKSDALLFGSLFDTLVLEPENEPKFLEEHPEMVSSRGATKGLLKSEFQRAYTMRDRLKQDSKMMAYLEGETQRIMTGEIFGLPFKIKMDIYKEHKAIIDLKSVESLRKAYWHPTKGKCTFVEYFDYILQGAIYQEIVYQKTGERLPFYLVCVSKEPVTDMALIYIDNESLHDALFGNEFGGGISEQVNRIRLLKSGEVKPIRCEHCAYCLPTKKIQKPIHFTELLGELDR